MDPALPFPLVQSYYPQFLFKFRISEIQGPGGLRTVLGLKGRHNRVGKWMIRVPTLWTLCCRGSWSPGYLLIRFHATVPISHCSCPPATIEWGSNYLPERQLSLEQD